ncbi:hypothetical protein ACH44C_33645 [Streptomyces purpureus]|uniref:hypothetical protein n=1 Tax=Streptomyces purpureus TaxID=1951 RepID=UPI0037AD043C
MPFYAGQRLTAGQMGRIQPRPTTAVGTATLTGPQTNADIPGATVTVTTETANATYKALAVFDLRATIASTGTALGRMSLDGVPQNPLATYNTPAASGRATVVQVYQGTLPTVGSHTLKLVATLAASQEAVGVNSSIMVDILEVI